MSKPKAKAPATRGATKVGGGGGKTDPVVFVVRNAQTTQGGTLMLQLSPKGKNRPLKKASMAAASGSEDVELGDELSLKKSKNEKGIIRILEYDRHRPEDVEEKLKRKREKGELQPGGSSPKKPLFKSPVKVKLEKGAPVPFEEVEKIVVVGDKVAVTVGVKLRLLKKSGPIGSKNGGNNYFRYHLHLFDELSATTTTHFVAITTFQKNLADKLREGAIYLVSNLLKGTFQDSPSYTASRATSFVECAMAKSLFEGIPFLLADDEAVFQESEPALVAVVGMVVRNVDFSGGSGGDNFGRRLVLGGGESGMGVVPVVTWGGGKERSTAFDDLLVGDIVGIVGVRPHEFKGIPSLSFVTSHSFITKDVPDSLQALLCTEPTRYETVRTSAGVVSWKEFQELGAGVHAQVLAHVAHIAHDDDSHFLSCQCGEDGEDEYVVSVPQGLYNTFDEEELLYSDVIMVMESPWGSNEGPRVYDIALNRRGADKVID